MPPGILPEKKTAFQLTALLLLFVSHLHFSYDFYYAWWYSALGFLLVCFFGWLVWGSSFRRVGGLSIRGKDLFYVLLTTVFSFTISFLLIWFLASGRGIVLSMHSVQSYVHDVFYILNEEIILGSLLLYLLVHKLNMAPLLSSAALALAVAVLHLVFYKWVFRDPGYLHSGALLSLFLTALLKNNLILHSRHIGYAWAIHFGWMVVMFGSEHLYGTNGQRLTDLEKFNYYLGSPITVILSLLLAGGSTWLLVRSGRSLVPAVTTLRNRQSE